MSTFFTDYIPTAVSLLLYNVFVGVWQIGRLVEVCVVDYVLFLCRLWWRRELLL